MALVKDIDRLFTDSEPTAYAISMEYESNYNTDSKIRYYTKQIFIISKSDLLCYPQLSLISSSCCKERDFKDRTLNDVVSKIYSLSGMIAVETNYCHNRDFGDVDYISIREASTLNIDHLKNYIRNSTLMLRGYQISDVMYYYKPEWSDIYKYMIPSDNLYDENYVRDINNVVGFIKYYGIYTKSIYIEFNTLKRFKSQLSNICFGLEYWNNKWRYIENMFYEKGDPHKYIVIKTSDSDSNSNITICDRHIALSRIRTMDSKILYSNIEWSDIQDFFDFKHKHISKIRRWFRETF